MEYLVILKEVEFFFLSLCVVQVPLIEAGTVTCLVVEVADAFDGIMPIPNTMAITIISQ
ncbi:hypothetical protein FD44_GL001759 [Secundilactobacillus malefermentans DSM 5705 = KCTC 3548]|nr:hypothetical protein FD44_GL001759 [Secundilactobacillus malefermentans DSM 5705 = KCTC 3548]